MTTNLTEDMIKHDLVFTCGKKILTNLFNDCFPQPGGVFSEESVKHHLFHCRFLYDTSNRCHIIKCEQASKRKRVLFLHESDFEKCYRKKDRNPCTENCSSCIKEWEPIEDANIDNLDFDVFKRLFQCKYITDNTDFKKCKASLDKILEFRDAVSHNRPMKGFKKDLLMATCLLKNKEEQISVNKKIEELFHELADTLEIRICNEHAQGRKSFLNDMLLNLPVEVAKKEKQKFAYGNLGFYFKDDSLSTKDPDLNLFIQQHQNMDNMNKCWLLHTICYFGIGSLLQQFLTEPELVPLINNVDYRNQNVLMNACEQTHWKIAETLLRQFTNNWNLHQEDCNGRTVMVMCLNNKKMIELFIELELIIGLSGFNDQRNKNRSQNDTDEQEHYLQKEVKNQQTSVQEEAWIALSFENIKNNKKLPTLLKSLDSTKWDEKDYLNTADSQKQLLLKCEDINSFELEAKQLNANSKEYHGQQRWDEPIDSKYDLQCTIRGETYAGLRINRNFEPVLVFPCGDDYRQEYILTNKLEDNEQEISGNIKKLDEDLCVTFKPQNDFLTLQRFYVTKRPKRRQYMLDPFQENIIFLDSGGTILFPKGCIEHTYTVDIWEKRMEPPNKDSKIKAGTDMIYVHSKRPMKLLKFVKFEFNGPCQPHLEPHLKPKLLKVSTTESSKYHIKVYKDKVNFDPERNKIDFQVQELCGKCVVLCEQKLIPDELLVTEVKLLYLNYKRCTAWFCLEKIANDVATAHVFLFMHNEDLPDKQKMQFEAFQKKPDLIIRDFCTFHIKCAGSFACKDEQLLHVQFFAEENHIKFEIEVKNNIEQGTFQVEGLPDITKFEVDFPGVKKPIDRKKEERHTWTDFPQLPDQPTMSKGSKKSAERSWSDRFSVMEERAEMLDTNKQASNVSTSKPRIEMVTSLKKVIKCADINTRYLDDGAYLPNGSLVVTDYSSNKLLLFDDSVTLQAQYDVKISPRGVCVSADGSLIYRVYYDGTLVTFRLHEGLREVSRFKVQGGTTGVGVSGDTIITGHDDNITLYNMEGKKLSSISKKGYPTYICVSQDGSRFYHRDGDHIVCRSVSDLSEVFRYLHPVLLDPWGIACDRHGNILVAGWISDNIIMIDKDGTHGRVLVDTLHGIRCPTGVCCHPQRDEFVVLSYGLLGNAMEVYEMK